VIVLFAEHTTLAPTIIDISLQPGNLGFAYMFRDRQVHKIFWSTIGGKYEQATQLQRPIRFVEVNGNPFPPKPGHTWINVMTIGSTVSEKEAGKWLARFYAPLGAK